MKSQSLGKTGDGKGHQNQALFMDITRQERRELNIMCGREEEKKKTRRTGPLFPSLSLVQTRDPGNDITDWVQGMKKGQTRKGRIRGKIKGRIRGRKKQGYIRRREKIRKENVKRIRNNRSLMMMGEGFALSFSLHLMPFLDSCCITTNITEQERNEGLN